MGLIVMLEKKDSIILLRKILELIPLTCFKAFQPLILSKLLPKDLFCCILNFILKLKFLLFSHLHLHSLCFFFCLIIDLLNIFILIFPFLFIIALLFLHPFLLMVNLFNWILILLLRFKLKAL